MRLLRALVVDDEYAARETLRRLVNWADFGFEAPVTAAHGMEALKYFKEAPFDLVLTDIEMPVMDGISLIEAIREENPPPSIVIVSCHEKFDYARRALQLGVEDYFIKDLLTEKELAAFLSNFALQAGARLSQVPPQRNTLSDALRLAVTGGGDVESDLPPPFFEGAALLAVYVDDYEAQRVDLGEEALMGRVSAFVAQTECLAAYYPGGDAAYFLFEVENNPSMLYYYTRVTGLADNLRFIAKKNEIRSVTIGVSNLISSAKSIGSALKQAREAAQMRIVNGQGHIIFFDTITLRRFAQDFAQTEYLLKSAEDFCYNANVACLSVIDKLYEAEMPSAFADIHYFRYVNARLWALTASVAKAQGMVYEALLSRIGQSVESVNRMENSREMSRFFKDCLLMLFAEDGRPRQEDLASQALKLIEREYSKDISLQYVADKLHTNKSYLSRLFKEKTGESVMNYIMQKKISRAKYLFKHTHMKLYEVSDSLSFASPQYLSTVFKRFTGLTPFEYKKGMEAAVK